MRKFLAFFCVFLAIFCSFSVFAKESRLSDKIGLLSESEQQAVREKLDIMSEKEQFDFVAVITDSTEGKTDTQFADDYFDYNGFGMGSDYDGALLLLVFEPDNRRCYISTCGRGVTKITDREIDILLDTVIDGYFAQGDYSGGIIAFPDKCAELLSEQPSHELKIDYITVLKWLGIALAVGIVAGGIYILVLRSKMKSVKPNNFADSYTVPGSMNITQAKDVYLYSNVVKTRRQTENNNHGSSHYSSSGRSHGGGGRSF